MAPPEGRKGQKMSPQIKAQAPDAYVPVIEISYFGPRTGFEALYDADGKIPCFATCQAAKDFADRQRVMAEGQYGCLELSHNESDRNYTAISRRKAQSLGLIW